MKTVLLSVFLLTGITASLSAQSFVYHPVSPTFGGSSFNYSWILGETQAQDRNVDPASRRTSTATNTSTTNSALDNFTQSIQNQILQRITTQLINNKFGENDLKPGTYTFGTYTVDIRNGTDGVVVRIVDGAGGETSVTVPYF
jgi:curli production assembly/transport component CsgF